MASEYTPSEVKPTGQTDLNGNGGFNVKFSTGEEAFMLAKKAPEVGVTEYGEIVDAVSKKGTTYKRFKRVQKEDGYVSQAPQPQPSNLEQRVEQLEKDVAILQKMTQSTPEAPQEPQKGLESVSAVSADDYLIDDIPF